MKPSILLIGNFLSSVGNNRTMAEEFAERLQMAGYSVQTTSSFQPRILRLLDMLRISLVRRQHYSLVYVEVYSGKAFLWGEMVCALLHLLSKPYILTLHGGNLPTFASRSPDRVRRLLQSADVVTAPSRYLQEEMRPYCQAILLLPNPLDISLYPFHLSTSPKLRLMWLRAFHQIYHPQLAVEVVARLRTEFADIHLTMIGPSKGNGSLQETRQLIEKLALQENVVIVPGIPKGQVPQYLAQADIFINTANIDNTPVSVIEAMACGLCIVSTNVGGIPYLLEDGKDALLVPPGDAQAMSSAVTRILTEPGLAERLSRNARQKAEQFDWSVVLPQWEKLFQEIIKA